jgi:hypothetical protein
MTIINPLIPVFIASPNDVGAERRLVEAAIHSLAPRFARIFGVTLVPLLWEEFAPISSYDASHPQIGILRRIQPFSIFVGILWNRCGTPVGDSGETGTETEFEYAIAHRNTISILSYFRKQTDEKRLGSEERLQRKQVGDLKRRLEKNNVSTLTYDNLAQFRGRILGDIMEAALDLVLSQEPRKIADFYNFFRFGSHWRLDTKPLLIVYPPIADPGPGHACPRLNWRKRLLPHVIYEDFKTIQDVEEAMRLLGRQYKTVTTDSPSLDMAEPGDRFWVCVPRSVKAQRALEQLKEQGVDVRFHFTSRATRSGPETCLAWRRSGRNIQIRSPLAKYLNHSARPARAAPWRPAFGHSYCRDYAVFARFKLCKDPGDSCSEYYYHYFAGGIRGLGTWGIGYLLDHESSRLVRMAADQTAKTGDENVQLLLEVTYENYRVTRIRDVSENAEAFFTKRYSDEYIRQQMKRHRDWL